MKMMSFNSSCAFAGLANMLEALGVDTEDRLIALEMGLPYLFAKEDGVYCAGPMLQGARWFDLYLRPRGFVLVEASLPHEQLPAFLLGHIPAMLGLQVGENSKHAVVFTRFAGDTYHFINNRHPSTGEPDELALTAGELMARTDPQVRVTTLEHVSPAPVDLKPALTTSLDTLAEYRRDMDALRHTRCDRTRLLSLMGTHLRAFLLDALTMMRLIHADSLAVRMAELQGTLLQAVRIGSEDVLSDLLPMVKFMRTLDDYVALIAEKARAI
ncbi:MAG: hypothetical protein ACI4ML_10810 [Aristaeellaceae bacterium]